MLSESQLKKIGFKKLGKNVKISDRASIYSPHLIELGDNIRIDDFCIISPGSLLRIGNYVHIACFCSLIGKEKIVLDDFSGLSSRVSIYSSTDDYRGEFLTNPTVPNSYTNVQSSPVTLKKHVIVGSSSVILPGVTINEGAAIGALTLVNKDVPAWEIWVGTPIHKLKDRKKQLLDQEWKLLSSLK